MAVKIRLSRVGKKKAPVYRIVAIDSRKKRDGAYLENLGTYDATRGIIVQFHQDRIDYWLSQGAQTTDSVKKIMKSSKKIAAGVTGDAVEPKKVEKKAKKTKAGE